MLGILYLNSSVLPDSMKSQSAGLYLYKYRTSLRVLNYLGLYLTSKKKKKTTKNPTKTLEKNMYFDNHDEQARFYGTAFSHKQKQR